MSVSRRVTLGWIAAASAGAWVLAGCEADAATLNQPAPWPDTALPPVTMAGYGQDPDLKAAMITWPLTLTPRQRDLVRASAELMLPADARSPSGGALPLDAFFDEWLSAPYPQQRSDRAVIVPGLDWLDAEAMHRTGADFTKTDDATRRAIFDAIAWRAKVPAGYERASRFFARLRGLMLAGYYSAPEGIADLGYMGNAPILGPYPGPTKEALDNLNATLAKLNLKPVS
jgi:hypothetical protein